MGGGAVFGSSGRGLADTLLMVVLLSGELVGALACHPEYKLLSVWTVPQMPRSSVAYSTFSWPGLLKHLRQMLVSNTKMEEGESSSSHRHMSHMFVSQH